MPTGYTAAIEEGEIQTGKDFLIRCARAFGACISMREDSLTKEIPVKFTPDDYHAKSLDRATKEFYDFKLLSDEQLQEKYLSDYKRSKENSQKSLDKELKIVEYYKKVRTEVEAWIPPTPNHFNLKDFALEQIKISNNEDSIEFYQKELERPIIEFDRWYKNQIESYEDNIQYHTEHLCKEEKSCDEKTEWIQQLRDSLLTA